MVLGFLWIVFYVLGFYAALYFLSLMLRTTAIVNFVFGIGAVLAWIAIVVVDLFALYLTLRYMFEDNFLLGLLILFVGLPFLHFLLQSFLIALGAPFMWFMNDLEERFSKTEPAKNVPYRVLDEGAKES